MIREIPELPDPAGETVSFRAITKGRVDASHLGFQPFNARGRAGCFEGHKLAVILQAPPTICFPAQAVFTCNGQVYMYPMMAPHWFCRNQKAFGSVSPIFKNLQSLIPQTKLVPEYFHPESFLRKPVKLPESSPVFQNKSENQFQIPRYNEKTITISSHLVHLFKKKKRLAKSVFYLSRINLNHHSSRRNNLIDRLTGFEKKQAIYRTGLFNLQRISSRNHQLFPIGFNRKYL